LDIAFHTKELRSFSISPTLAAKKLGKDTAAALRAALADVDAATNPEELPICLIPSDESAIEFRLSLTDCCFAVFASNHSRDREASPGTKAEWQRVNRVKLMGITQKND
jgi:hypothetical protein